MLKILSFACKSNFFERGEMEDVDKVKKVYPYRDDQKNSQMLTSLLEEDNLFIEEDIVIAVFYV